MQLLKIKREQLGYCGHFLGAIVVALVLAACEKSADEGAPQGMPPVPVGYVTVKAANIGVVSELPGRLEAFRVAEVRPQVSGIILHRLFEEGSDVKAGQSLFQIDDAVYQSSLQSAQAQLAQAQASYTQAKARADRYKPLVSANAVSKQDYDDAYAAQKVAEANILAAKAAITAAKINIDYAKVLSPIDGRIGRAYVTEGALVGVTTATPMAVVQQIHPLYVNFTQTATDVIKLQQDIRDGHYKVASDGSIPVTVILENGEEYSEGKLLFTDLTVDASTGKVSLRAEVPNPQKILLPNLYVRVRLEQATVPNAFVVPQQAVVRSAQGDTLMVITPDEKVEPRMVTIGGRDGTGWIITSGIQDGERVMVDGFIKWQGMQSMAGENPVKLQLIPFDGNEAMPLAAQESAAVQQDAAPQSTPPEDQSDTPAGSETVKQ